MNDNPKYLQEVFLSDMYSDQQSELTDKHFYFYMHLLHVSRSVDATASFLLVNMCTTYFDPRDNVHYHSYNVNLEANIASEIDAIWI